MPRTAKKQPASESRALAIDAARVCDSKKAENIVILDIHGMTFICDYFVIATTSSSRQSKAIAEELIPDFKARGYRPVSTEGLRDSKWMLIDFGGIVVHLFQPQEREFYDLESHWAEAKRLRWKPARKRSAPAAR